MATNVTTDSVVFYENQLILAEKHLSECLARIENYNTNTIPAKKRTIEEMNKKKLEKGKPLLEFNLVPIDPDTNEEVLGLRKRIEAYNVVISLANNPAAKIVFKRDFSYDDYIKLFESKEETSSIRLSCAKSRLDKNRKKLAENKKKNPKKYGKRPDLPEVNTEMINESRKLEHWRKALSLLRSKKKYAEGIKPKRINSAV